MAVVGDPAIALTVQSATCVTYTHALFQPKFVIEQTIKELGIAVPKPYTKY